MSAFLRHIGQVSVSMNSSAVRDKTAPGWGGKKRRFTGQVARVGTASASAYSIPFSGDFNGTDGYLAFTPASAGNRQVWTFSTWANRDGTGRDSLFGAGGSDTVFHYIQFTAGHKLDVHHES